MADRYNRIRLNMVSSSVSDYSRPKARLELETLLTLAEFTQLGPIECATTPGTTITTSQLTSASKVIIYNEDPTNFITYVFNSAGSSTNTMKLTAGQWDVISDFTASANLVITADTAACAVSVWVFGT